ncbi:hypothetical protein [Streptomonospora wellingtoniae]|uniref:Uncharacterized protein n=1 Tax=Streptomonospora wellingtoniae TaxID=3075544 RepID=A0ABU2KU12_9ACTN|nr:hypothetical protein [Streptomonospora sp. DSM 45055]MDT0302558.1 hypothetical protein [Streptomonospora sp. DSM 45055]
MTTERSGSGAAGGRGPRRPRRWMRWTPAAAPLWSLGYGLMGVFWALTAAAPPFEANGDPALAPLAARFGAGPASAAVLLVGLPAAAVGAAMLKGVRTGRRPLIAAGALVAALLLLCMIDVRLLMVLGYVPYGLVGVVAGDDVGEVFLSRALTGGMLHQVACLAGGLLWAAAALAYARRSGGGCVRCGRNAEARGWTSPASAARWGSVAVYVAMAPPLLYAATRFAWWLGIPIGITREFLREGQADGSWTAGAFLAGFATVGAVLTLGLIQRWGEVFPRWMPGLAGRRVPVALAVLPACAVAVLVFVGGIAMVSGYAAMAGGFADSSGQFGAEVLVGLLAALFPVWGVALAVAALGYHLRRRGSCADCGRGAQHPFPAPAG